jgi:hypothetical protein
MSAISPLSGDKRTSGEWVENDANDQLPNSSTPFSRKKSPPFMDASLGPRAKPMSRRELIELIVFAAVAWAACR